MLLRQKVYSETELRSRYEIMLENYCKTIAIEANTMAEMTRKEILPAVTRYCAAVAEDAGKKRALVPTLRCAYETELVEKLSALSDRIAKSAEALEATLAQLSAVTETAALSEAIRDTLLPGMTQLRAAADEAEVMTAREYWPFPTYGELLFAL